MIQFSKVLCSELFSKPLFFAHQHVVNIVSEASIICHMLPLIYRVSFPSAETSSEA